MHRTNAIDGFGVEGDGVVGVVVRLVVRVMKN